MFGTPSVLRSRRSRHALLGTFRLCRPRGKADPRRHNDLPAAANGSSVQRLRRRNSAAADGAHRPLFVLGSARQDPAALVPALWVGRIRSWKVAPNPSPPSPFPAEFSGPARTLMSAVAFAALPDDARVWIFSAARPLEENEAARLLQSVDAFLERWVAHGRPVVGARDLRHARFLLIAADERATGVSGCSIDYLFHTLQETERELDLSLLDPSRVDFRDANNRSTPSAGDRSVSESRAGTSTRTPRSSTTRSPQSERSAAANGKCL